MTAYNWGSSGLYTTLPGTFRAPRTAQTPSLQLHPLHCSAFLVPSLYFYSSFSSLLSSNLKLTVVIKWIVAWTHLHDNLPGLFKLLRYQAIAFCHLRRLSIHTLGSTFLLEVRTVFRQSLYSRLYLGTLRTYLPACLLCSSSSKCPPFALHHYTTSHHFTSLRTS